MNKYNIDDILIQLSIPPAAAQIAGVLLSSKPGAHSHTSLHETLSLSKAAITGGLQYLEALDTISYSAGAGRRRVIILHPHALVSYIKRRMVAFSRLASSLQQLASMQEDEALSRETETVAALCNELDKVVSKTIKRWEDENAKKRQDIETAIK